MALPIEIVVYGMPAPQGSKRPVGRGIMIESSAKVKPWRESIKWAVLAARQSGEVLMLSGPVEVEIIFTMSRPKSAKRGSLPFKRPDVDKLVRSTFDALTESMIYEDDSRVVRLKASKVFPNEGDGALNAPGAVIRVKEVT